MSTVYPFKIEVTCCNCGSQNVESEISMSQGAGFIGFECMDCDNKPEIYLGDADLDEIINIAEKVNKSEASRYNVIFDEEDVHNSRRLPTFPTPMHKLHFETNHQVDRVVPPYELGKR